MSRLFESDEGPPWFTDDMVKRESITGISLTVTHYSLVIVTENCQIKGNLGYSDSF